MIRGGDLLLYPVLWAKISTSKTLQVIDYLSNILTAQGAI